MKKLLIVIILVLFMVLSVYADDGGHFNDKDIWIPDDLTIQATYKIPELTTGVIFDKNTIYTTLGVEIYDRRKICGDILVSNGLIALSISKRWTSIIEFKTGIFVAYSWTHRWSRKSPGLTFGLSFLLSKF